MRGSPSVAAAVLLAAGCAPAIKSNVSAVGAVSGISMVSLARTSAESRAVAELQMLLKPDAVSFVFRHNRDGSSLEYSCGGLRGGDGGSSLSSSGERASYGRVDFQKLPGGLAATASGVRSAASVAAMRPLKYERVSVEAAGKDPGRALTKARSQALRQVLLRRFASCAKTKEGCRVSGTMTIGDMSSSFTDKGAALSLAAAVKVEQQAALSREDLLKIFDRELSELIDAERWKETGPQIEKLRAETGDEAAAEAAQARVLVARGPEKPKAAAAGDAEQDKDAEPTPDELRAEAANLAEALSHQTKACKLAAAYCERAKELGEEAAVAKLKVGASQGDAAAQFKLGTRLTEGKGAREDKDQALKWIDKALAQKYAPARRWLEQTACGPDAERFYYQPGKGKGTIMVMKMDDPDKGCPAKTKPVPVGDFVPSLVPKFGELNCFCRAKGDKPMPPQ